MLKLLLIAAALIGSSLPGAAENGPAQPGMLVGDLTSMAAGRTVMPHARSDAAWGVQLSGSFSKAVALASFERIRAVHAVLVGDSTPIVISAALGNRGPGPLHRVRVPAGTRMAAVELCDRIRLAGGNCIVLPMGR
jgi:hypothetical protein